MDSVIDDLASNPGPKRDTPFARGQRAKLEVSDGMVFRRMCGRWRRSLRSAVAAGRHAEVIQLVDRRMEAFEDMGGFPDELDEFIDARVAAIKAVRAENAQKS